MNKNKDYFYTVYKFSIDPYILINNYCCKCGNKLKRRFKQVVSYKKSTISFFFNRRNVYIKTVYNCTSCGYCITCVNQRKIKKEQKKTNNKFLFNSNHLIKELKINKDRLLNNK